MRPFAFCASLVLSVAVGCAPAPANPDAAPAPATPAAASPAAADAVSGAIRNAWQAARLNIRESADLMVEADYGFRPVDSVRTFAQMLTHVAGANYTFCSAARGETSPQGEDSFENKVTARADIIRVLDESLVYCDAAYTGATDASLAETIAQPFGGGDGPRAAALIGNIGHLNEHYGNLVTYFRVKGIVPPSSRR